MAPVETPFLLKHKPEDFRVDETADIAFSKSGAYAVYILSKRNQNTVDALRQLVLSLKLGGLGDFSYGGKKDRRALTTQYIAYHGKRFPDQKGNGYEAVFAGFLERPMGPDLVSGNRYTLKVRNIQNDSFQRAIDRIEQVAESGFENYFDDQRFSNHDPDHGWFAERLLKEQFNGALKTHLCSIFPDDSEETRERKATIFKNWRNWETLKKIAKTKYELLCVYTLARKPDAYLELLRKLPKDEVAFHFTAYQAHFWNEVVRRLLETDFDRRRHRRFRYPGSAGDYLFYERDPERSEWLRSTYLPTLSALLPKIVADPAFWDIYRRLLTECGLRRAELNDLKIRQHRFESRLRPILVKPEKVEFSGDDDECFAGKKQLKIRFNLPRASYASMFLKRLFADESGASRKARPVSRRD